MVVGQHTEKHAAAFNSTKGFDLSADIFLVAKDTAEGLARKRVVSRQS